MPRTNGRTKHLFVVSIGVGLALTCLVTNAKTVRTHALPKFPRAITFECVVGNDAVINALTILSCSHQTLPQILLPKVGSIDHPVDTGRGTYLHRVIFGTNDKTTLDQEVCGEGIVSITVNSLIDGMLKGRLATPDRESCQRVFFDEINGPYALLVETQLPNTGFKVEARFGSTPPPMIVPPPIVPPFMPPPPPPP